MINCFFLVFLHRKWASDSCFTNLSLNSLCIYFNVLQYLVLFCDHTHTHICAKSLHICINLLHNFVCHKLRFSFKVQLSPQCNGQQRNLMCASQFLFCYSCSFPIRHFRNTNCKFIMQIQTLVFFS